MSTNLAQIVDTLSALSVMDAAELSKMLEEKWGVSAAAPVAAAGPAAAAGPVAEAQTEFSVNLVSVPADKKIGIIKVVREITGLGLKEAKDLVEAAPKEVKGGVGKDEAEKHKKALADAGATVEVK